MHAHSLTAPRGWQLVRHDGDYPPPTPPPDDLLALAEAVRERPDQPMRVADADPGVSAVGAGQAGAAHLRLVPPS